MDLCKRPCEEGVSLPMWLVSALGLPNSCSDLYAALLTIIRGALTIEGIDGIEVGQTGNIYTIGLADNAVQAGSGIVVTRNADGTFTVEAGLVQVDDSSTIIHTGDGITTPFVFSLAPASIVGSGGTTVTQQLDGTFIVSSAPSSFSSTPTIVVSGTGTIGDPYVFSYAAGSITGTGMASVTQNLNGTFNIDVPILNFASTPTISVAGAGTVPNPYIFSLTPTSITGDGGTTVTQQPDGSFIISSIAAGGSSTQGSASVAVTGVGTVINPYVPALSATAITGTGALTAVQNPDSTYTLNVPVATPTVVAGSTSVGVTGIGTLGNPYVPALTAAAITGSGGTTATFNPVNSTYDISSAVPTPTVVAGSTSVGVTGTGILADPYVPALSSVAITGSGGTTATFNPVNSTYDISSAAASIVTSTPSVTVTGNGSIATPYLPALSATAITATGIATATQNPNGTYTINVPSPTPLVLADTPSINVSGNGTLATPYIFDFAAGSITGAGSVSVVQNPNGTYTITGTAAALLYWTEAYNPALGVTSWNVINPSFAAIGATGLTTNRDAITLGGLGTDSVDFSQGSSLPGMARGINGGILSGTRNNIAATSPASAIVTGNLNSIAGTASDSMIGGGTSNTITSSSNSSIVSGNLNNMSGATSSTIGGGSSNTVSGSFSTIGGGTLNTSSANGAAILGGQNNRATAIQSVVGGGISNAALGVTCAILGGSSNITEAGAISGFIGGGDVNRVRSNRSAVVAGTVNIAGTVSIGEDSAVIAGSANHSYGTRCLVGTGNLHSVEDSSRDCAIVTGSSNIITARDSIIGAGQSNTIDGTISLPIGADGHMFVGAGYDNAVAFSQYSAVVAGQGNNLTRTTIGPAGQSCVIVAGTTNTVIGGGNDHFVGAGRSNTLTGGAANNASVIVGGTTNAVTATGNNSGVLSGTLNSCRSLNATISGGASGIIDQSGNQGFIGGGSNNTVGSLSAGNGVNSAVLCGASNTVTGQRSAALAGQSNIVILSNVAVPLAALKSTIEDKLPFGNSTVSGSHNTVAASNSHIVGHSNLNRAHHSLITGSYLENTEHSSLIVGKNGKSTTSLDHVAFKACSGTYQDQSVAIEIGRDSLHNASIITDAVHISSHTSAAYYFPKRDIPDDDVGYFVQLNEDGMVSIADKDVLGVTTTRTGVVHNSQEQQWKGKYMRDEFGRPLTRISYVDSFLEHLSRLSYDEIEVEPMLYNSEKAREEAFVSLKHPIMQEVDAATMSQEEQDIIMKRNTEEADKYNKLLRDTLKDLALRKQEETSKYTRRVSEFIEATKKRREANFSSIHSVLRERDGSDLISWSIDTYGAHWPELKKLEGMMLEGREVPVMSPDYDPTIKYIPRSKRVEEWVPVVHQGVVRVRDDGTCKVGARCVNNGGIATYSVGGTWRVISRISQNVVTIIL
jgi:hypothetical protein